MAWPWVYLVPSCHFDLWEKSNPACNTYIPDHIAGRCLVGSLVARLCRDDSQRNPRTSGRMPLLHTPTPPTALLWANICNPSRVNGMFSQEQSICVPEGQRQNSPWHRRGYIAIAAIVIPWLCRGWIVGDFGVCVRFCVGALLRVRPLMNLCLPGILCSPSDLSAQGSVEMTAYVQCRAR